MESIIVFSMQELAPETGSGAAASSAGGQKIKAVLGFIIEVIQIVIIAAAIVIPVRYFLIQPFNVKGASMQPNFYDSEYLIIDELSFRLRLPERGEVIVFRYPQNPREFFIKRVIGLPGETVEVLGGRIVIYNKEHPNGITLIESYLNGALTEGKKKVTLASDEYWVMGDNRGESLDSRSFGPLNKEFFIGRVWWRGLPLTRLGGFDLPEYNL